jgi:uncharacterized protein YdeI (BOF family)
MKKKIAAIVTVTLLFSFFAFCTWSNSEIYYEITTTQSGTVYVEYTTPNGVARATYSLPFTSSKYIFSYGAFVSLSVSRYSGSGTVSVRIYKDGSVWKSAAITGAESVTISGSL